MSTESEREQHRDYMRAYRARNPEYFQRDRDNARVFMKAYRERKLYGLEPGEYERMLEEQENRCAICGVLSDVLCVDHDHTTDEVRGLLCKPCNLVLGMVGDNVERLMRAAEYLGRYRDGES